GHRVSAIAVLPAGSSEPPLIERLKDGGVSVTVSRVAGRAYHSERREFETLLAGRSGIVHTHGYRTDVVNAPVARRLGFATVTTLHGFTGGDFKNLIYEYLQRRSSR